MTKQILVGGVPIGGGAPVVIQSMLNTKTTDVEGSLKQIRQLASAGCQIARLAVPNMEAARSFADILSLIHIFDRITVEYYGSETPLNGVATISTPDARTLIIQPWDTKLLKDIQKAIQTSDLGINPQNDGRVIRLVFPQLTEERRKDLAKQVKKYSEEAKVAMRNIRRDGMDYVKKLKKNSEITEDDQKKAEKDLQDLLDKNIKRADAALAAKEKELMAI